MLVGAIYKFFFFGFNAFHKFLADKKEMEVHEEEDQQKQQQQLEQSPLAKRPKQQRMLRLAVAGCSHGEMDTIYARFVLYWISIDFFLGKIYSQKKIKKKTAKSEILV